MRTLSIIFLFIAVFIGGFAMGTNDENEGLPILQLAIKFSMMSGVCGLLNSFSEMKSKSKG